MAVALLVLPGLIPGLRWAQGQDLSARVRLCLVAVLDHVVLTAAGVDTDPKPLIVLLEQHSTKCVQFPG